jgi:putative DNA primase/helicase
MHSLPVETIREALRCIPADLARDDWARIAMALKSELADAGFELFEEWSKQGAKYDAKATRDTWRSVKAGGRVRIGTLMHMAKQHGYRADAVAPAQAASPEAVQARRQARAGQEEREREQRAATQRKAADDAARQWGEATESGESGYLTRKRVRAHGVRYAADGWLLVPMRDAEGELWNVQRIAPERGEGKSDKLYLKGGRKNGLWHWCGATKNAPALLIAEGYATAASVHEATGRPVAVAFDSGNLAHVARALRGRYRSAPILICADDDRDTEARTGLNTGREKAQAAARAIRGAVVWPDQLPEGGSDFNDMANHAGLEAVRECIEAAITAHASGGDGSKRADAVTAGPDRFTVNEGGVWYTEHDSDGRAKSPLWVCSRLLVPALTRDGEGQSWGYLLEFKDPAGVAKQWAMAARMLAGDGVEFRATLMGLGLRVATGNRARALLAHYVQTRQTSEHARCTDRIGWHGAAFVLPRETLSDGGERIVFQTDGTAENTFKQRGTLEGWRERVASHCVGNSRLVFAVACGFAGPMLRPSGIDSGGFHYRGDSSSGKTTALRVAASVYGGSSYMQRWRATDNALEAIAAQHCDVLLILDELAQVDPKTAGECAYMLANESAKARSTRNGQTRPRVSWRLLFLSAGETGLAAHMAEGGKRARPGQELRLADVPADAGAGLGVFEELHGHENGATFAAYLSKATEANHGTAGYAFLTWATRNADTLRDRVHSGVERLAGQWVPERASGQVHRVGRRFAAVAVAGELATEAGITGWPESEATRAARTCFHAWLESRGGIGNAEEGQMLRQVRQFLEANGDGRFASWDRTERNDEHAPKTLHRVGFRKTTTDELGGVGAWEYYVLRESFRTEICAGFDPKAVLRLLRDRGHLVPDKGRPFDCRARLPGMGPTACYRIKSSIFDAGDDE